MISLYLHKAYAEQDEQDAKFIQSSGIQMKVMPTLQLFQKQPDIPLWLKYALWAILLCCIFTIQAQFNIKVTVLFCLVTFSLFISIKELIYSQNFGFTLTSTHLQQHLYRGGWLLQWKNIKHAGSCEYTIQGWNTDIPWIGIEMNNYQPFIEHISLKAIRHILVHQRNLLYLGLKQHRKQHEFENHIINDTAYTFKDGRTATGLRAMLINRMIIQRELWGYDIFIAECDLTISKSEFIGLTRRYLAAS
ncbi:DUF2982 domain-containing protein [Vibrio hibernica]|uniref:DUF2982 domain-containing protein n=1 Tax=Vibrio hibernica TaxID=2587465 RepID=UPI00187F7F8D|nr:DUF2982 domain-containing protein [Vibrio hibernica]